MNGESTESSIGITARKRAEGARGVKRKRNGEDVVIEHVAEMSNAITQLLNGMTQPAPAPVNSEEINEIIERLVNDKMRETNKLIEAQAAMISDIHAMLRSKGGE